MGSFYTDEITCSIYKNTEKIFEAESKESLFYITYHSIILLLYLDYIIVLQYVK